MQLLNFNTYATHMAYYNTVRCISGSVEVVMNMGKIKGGILLKVVPFFVIVIVVKLFISCLTMTVSESPVFPCRFSDLLTRNFIHRHRFLETCKNPTLSRPGSISIRVTLFYLKKTVRKDKICLKLKQVER